MIRRPWRSTLCPYTRGTAPILFSIKVERIFQIAQHADRFAVFDRRIEFDLPSGFDGFARQAVGQSADHTDILHFAVDAKNDSQYHRALLVVDSRDLRV